MSLVQAYRDALARETYNFMLNPDGTPFVPRKKRIVSIEDDQREADTESSSERKPINKAVDVETDQVVQSNLTTTEKVKANNNQPNNNQPETCQPTKRPADDFEPLDIPIIELKIKPVLELKDIPVERKSKPGFFTADFDLSDEEEVSISPVKRKLPKLGNSFIRRPAFEDPQILKRRQELLAQKENKLAKPIIEPAPKDIVTNGSILSEARRQLEPRAPIPFSFGVTDEKKPGHNVTSPFSFGITGGKEAEQKATDNIPFKFGVKSAETVVSKPEAEKSLFQFNTSTVQPSGKPLFGTTEQPVKPGPFLFGVGAGAGTEPKPAISLGNAPAADSKPVFGQPEDKPLISFGTTENKPTSHQTEKPQDEALLSSAATIEKIEPAAENPKDQPLFSFGTAVSSNASVMEQKSEMPLDKTKFSFSTANNNGPAVIGPTVEQKSGKSPFQLGDTPYKPPFSFSSNSTNETAKSVGEATLQIAGSGELSGGLSFGKSGETKPPFSFDTVKKDTKEMSATSLFGSTTAPFSFGKTESANTPSFSFGTQKDTTGESSVAKSAGSATQTAPLFGSATTLEVSSVPLFGTANGSAPIPPPFGGPSGDKISTPTRFASSSPVPATASLFGGPEANLSQPATSNLAFGASDKPPPSPFGSAKSFTFGQSSATESSAGQSKEQQSTFGKRSLSPSAEHGKPTKTSGVFGATTAAKKPNVVSSGGAGPTFTFGSQPNFTFGAAKEASKPVNQPFSFGTTTAAPASGAFSFGSDSTTSAGNSTPSLNASAAPSFSFGASSSSSQQFQFGNANTTQFSATTNANPFGGQAGAVSPAPFALGVNSGAPAAPGGSNMFAVGVGATGDPPANSPIAGRKIAQMRSRRIRR
jgi:hypothetical protein